MNASTLMRTRILIWAGIVFFCGALLWFGGSQLLRYRERQQFRSLVAQGRENLRRGDIAEATLNARTALSIDIDSPDAARLMAEAAERVARADALRWRMRVIELVPESAEDQLALASL